MEKDDIFQVSLHIRDNKIKIGSMSNKKVHLASPVPETKYFRIIPGFSKFCSVFRLFHMTKSCHLFLIHNMWDRHIHLNQSSSIPFIVSQAEYIVLGYT